MKHFTLISVLSLFFFVGSLSAQIDYSVGISTSPFTICSSGNNQGGGVFAQIIDSGVNGQPTYYQYSTTSPLVLAGPTAGSVSDGGMNFTGCSVIATGVPVGEYTVELDLSSDPLFLTDVVTVSFTVTVNDVPVAKIRTPDGSIICDGNPVVLIGEGGEGITATYNWTPGPEDQASWQTANPNTYELEATNFCGADTTDVTITSGTSPSLLLNTCTVVANVANISVTAEDPDNLGLTFTWYENDNPISTGGDFTIITVDEVSTLTVTNIGSNHQGSAFYCVVENDCGDFQTPVCVTLPVELIYFSGKLDNQAVELSWATATETNSDKFIIERSYDGREFKAIGELAAAGESFTELEYKYLDSEALSNVDQIYYRLNQIDIDGTASLSHLVTVRPDAEETFQIESVFSADQEISLQYYAPQGGKFTATIYNLSGQALETIDFEAFEGFNRKDFSNIDLPGGFYLLHLTDGFKTDVRKFVR
ncbi:MAG: T9SS type A sorting domain-containing protein [Bacteroidetes bacterium]|nr:T9SS type A sorting domain-containing protein [Bacteroidota bacterium]